MKRKKIDLDEEPEIDLEHAVIIDDMENSGFDNPGYEDEDLIDY